MVKSIFWGVNWREEDHWLSITILIIRCSCEKCSCFAHAIYAERQTCKCWNLVVLSMEGFATVYDTWNMSDDDPPHPQHVYIRTSSPRPSEKRNHHAPTASSGINTRKYWWAHTVELLLCHFSHAGFDELVSRCVGFTQQYRFLKGFSRYFQWSSK